MTMTDTTTALVLDPDDVEHRARRCDLNPRLAADAPQFNPEGLVPNGAAS